MPFELLQNKTPYEMLFQVKPDLTYLRSFGCLCFVSTTTVGRDKFMPKAHPCVFIGYQFGQKGYKMYNLVTKKLLVSRDVRFFENIYPLHALTNNHLTPTYPSYIPSSISDDILTSASIIPAFTFTQE